MTLSNLLLTHKVFDFLLVLELYTYVGIMHGDLLTQGLSSQLRPSVVNVDDFIHHCKGPHHFKCASCMFYTTVLEMSVLRSPQGSFHYFHPLSM